MNDKHGLCPCGSGKTFRFCCDESHERLRSPSEEFTARSFPHQLTGDPEGEMEFGAWCEEIAGLLEQGQLENAGVEIEGMANAYPGRWEPLYFRAMCFVFEGDVEQAMSIFDRIIAVKPSAEAYFNLANVHRSLGHIEEWITCLKQVIRLAGPRHSLGKIARQNIDDFASRPGADAQADAAHGLLRRANRSPLHSTARPGA